MSVAAILLAAGEGKRLRQRVSKPLVRVAGRSLISYSLQTLNAIAAVTDIIVVVNRGNEEAIRALLRRGRFKKIAAVCLGGRERQDSVRAGLACLPQGCTQVLIHDAARPFMTGDLIRRLLREASARGAAVPGVPVRSTIKKVAAGNRIERTVERAQLREIQTPQVFSVELIRRAYERCGAPVTDDAMLLERCGIPVFVVPGEYRNIKITVPEDLAVAALFARRSRT